MAFHRTKDGFEFECDSCADIWTPPRVGRGSSPRDFNESWGDAKQDGWICFKDKKTGEFVHKCSKCKW